MISLLTGPVRSGKSTRAQRLAERTALPVTYVATHRVDPTDREFGARLERHRADRPASWTLIETAGAEQHDLAEVIAQCVPGTAFLVDSLGSWVSDLLLSIEDRIADDYPEAECDIERRTATFLDALPRITGELILVSEETGWGVVPPSPLGRLFRDAMGRLNQRVAAVADRALLVVAGHAVDLKRYGDAID